MKNRTWIVLGFGVLLAAAATVAWSFSQSDRAYEPKAQTWSAGSIIVAHGIHLPRPRASVTTPPGDSVPIVIVTTKDIWVGDQHIADIPADANEHGLAARDKRNGTREDLMVSPLSLVLQYLRSDGAITELRVVADEAVPRRVLLEVFFTAGQAEYRTMHIAATLDGALVWERNHP